MADELEMISLAEASRIANIPPRRFKRLVDDGKIATDGRTPRGFLFYRARIAGDVENLQRLAKGA